MFSSSLRYGQLVALDADLNVFFFKSGQIGFQDEFVARVDNIGAAGGDGRFFGAAEKAVVYHLVESVEEIAGPAVERHHVKHRSNPPVTRFVFGGASAPSDGFSISANYEK